MEFIASVSYDMRSDCCEKAESLLWNAALNILKLYQHQGRYVTPLTHSCPLCLDKVTETGIGFVLMYWMKGHRIYPVNNSHTRPCGEPWSSLRWDWMDGGQETKCSCFCPVITSHLIKLSLFTVQCSGHQSPVCLRHAPFLELCGEGEKDHFSSLCVYICVCVRVCECQHH